MEEPEIAKRKLDSHSILSPVAAKHVKIEEAQDFDANIGAPIPGLDNQSRSSTTSCDTSRGNVTIIHVQPNGKHAGSRMQWTFPRSYLLSRTRSTTPQSPCIGNKIDAELNTASLNGSFAPEAVRN
jgi:hypothetical protein